MLTVNLLTKMFILSGMNMSLKTSLNNLNPPSEFDDIIKAFEKKLLLIEL